MLPTPYVWRIAHEVPRPLAPRQQLDLQQQPEPGRRRRPRGRPTARQRVLDRRRARRQPPLARHHSPIVNSEPHRPAGRGDRLVFFVIGSHACATTSLSLRDYTTRSSAQRRPPTARHPCNAVDRGPLACPRRFTPARTPFACRPGRKLTRAHVRAPDDCIGRVKPQRLPSCSSSRARASRPDPSERHSAVQHDRLAVRRDPRPGRAGSSSRFTRSTNRARAGRLFV